MSYNQYDLANASLVKTGGLTEMYIPLWWYSSGTTSVTQGTYYLLQKGTTTTQTNVSPITSTYLHTLNSNWNPNQKFALESSFYIANASYTAQVILMDITTSTAAQISGSKISTMSTTSTVIRSGQFTLTPGHTYGVGIASSTACAMYLSKASLVAFIGG